MLQLVSPVAGVLTPVSPTIMPAQWHARSSPWFKLDTELTGVPVRPYLLLLATDSHLGDHEQCPADWPYAGQELEHPLSPNTTWFHNLDIELGEKVSPA